MNIPTIISSFPFTVDECKGQITHKSPFTIVVEGTIVGSLSVNRVDYLASSPYDLRASFTGSALPYPSPEFAMQGTPNKGSVQLDTNNTFRFKLLLPNSYYIGMGTILVPPTVYLTYTLHSGVKRTSPIQLQESIPYRTLTYNVKRSNAMFYNVALPVRSQEQILRDSEYPSTELQEPSNFWGNKPPM